MPELWTKDGYSLRPARAEDAEEYYAGNFCPLDWEVARLTGSREQYTREEVISFFHKSLKEDRYQLLILSPEGRIVGETVINEIDRVHGCANFRIAIFHGAHRNRGIGTWATEVTRDFAFGELKLSRLELEVFPFNPRARAVYRKAGFREIAPAGDDHGILMAMLRKDWKNMA